MEYAGGYTRRSNMQRELEPVAITSVDPTSRTATGVTRIRTTLTINCAFATGDTITTPAVGEQWYVERIDMEWRLYGRIPFNDATLGIEPEEGQVSVGSASGPLELNGTEIRANATSFRLNGAYYRDDGQTLLRSVDGDLWEPIFANATGNGNGTAGVLQMLAHRLADIPVTPEVTEYLADLSPAEAAALTDLAEWADGLQETIGGGWDALCNNPFFSNLRQLGDGDSPLDEVVSGLQNFLNDLFGLLFCQFDPQTDGDVTPQALTGALGGLQQLFTGDNQTGDFLRGLQNILPQNQRAGNLLVDAVTGTVKFFQELFDILFCADAQVSIDPAAILTQLGTIFDPLKNNPFLLGLQKVFTDAGNASTNLFTDAIEGTVKIIEDLFSALFCDLNLSGDFTPQVVFDQLRDNILVPLRDNPFIQALTDLAERMGVQFNNNLTGAISGAVEFGQLVFGVLTCNLSPAQVTKVDDLIETATGGLLPADIFDFLQNKLIKPLKNDFVEGLAAMFRATNNLNRSLLEDAIAGAEQLIEVIQDIFTCNVDGTLVNNIKALVGPDAIGVTPAKIVKLLDDFFDTFRSNPFVTGLQNFWTTLGNQASTVAQDAVRGATEFFRYVFDLLLCKPGAGANLTAIKGLAGTSFTPAKIVKEIDDFFDRFRTNPFIKGLQDFWTSLGNTAENLLQDAVQGASRFVEFLFDLITCQVQPGQLANILGLANSETGTGITPAGLVKNVDDFLAGFRSNPFLKGLQDFWVTLGNNTENFLQDAIQGASRMVEFLFDLITCQVQPGQLASVLGLANSETGGGVTPAKLIQNIDDFFDTFRSNPFLKGLQDFWTSLGNTAENLLQDAIQGASRFVEFLFDLMTCNTQPGQLASVLGLANSETGPGVTPAGLVKNIDDFFAGFRANPFITGLQQFWTNLGNTTNGLFRDIADGATEFFQFISDLLLCRLTPAQISAVKSQAGTAFTPAKIVKEIDDFFDGFRTNPFVKGLQDFWVTLGNTTENLLQDAVRGASGFVQFLFDLMTCNTQPGQLANILGLANNETGAGLTPAGLIKNVDDFFDGFRSNPFITGLQQFWTNLGNTTNGLLRDVADGATEFFQFISDLVQCKLTPAQISDVTGLAGTSFTPAKIIKEIDDFFQPLRDNPFLTGLRNFVSQTTGNLFNDAIKGATEFFEFITDFLQCNLSTERVNAVLAQAGSAFTPAKIIKNIDDFFEPFRANPFLTGLQNLLDSGVRTNNLLTDAVKGATEFIQVVFGALNCDAPQLIKLNSLAGSAAATSATPVGILASLKQTFLGSSGSGGLLGNTWVQIFNDIANRQGLTGNLLNKIADGFAAVMDFFFDDILGGLFPNVGFKDAIVNFPNGIQDWLDDLNLAKLLDPLGLGEWFRDNIFKPILKAITGLPDATLDSMLDPKTAIATFFTNVRKFFGEGLIGDWLDDFGGGLLNANFNPIAALRSFISDVLVQGIDNLWDALVDGLTSISNNLVKALTGQPITGILGDGLKAIRDFFDGFSAFNPATGENSLISQIVKAVLGEDGQFGLDDLKRFFDFTNPDNLASNLFKIIVEAITDGVTQFTSGPLKALADFFNPTHATNLFKNLVDAITNGTTSFLNGPLKALADFFNPTHATNLFKNLVDVITGAVTSFTSTLTAGPLKALREFFDPDHDGQVNVFKTIVDTITSHNTGFLNGPLKALADFFDFDKTSSLLNTIVETMIGTNVLSGTGPLAKLSQLFNGITLTGGKSLVTQIIDQVNYIAEVLGLNSIVASITGVNVDELENSYLLTFGGTVTGGTFTLGYGGQTTAAITYSTTTSTTAANIKSALDALTNIDNSIVTFGNGKYTVALNNTVGTLTAGTVSLTGTSPTLTVAQKFRGSLDALAQFFTGFGSFTGSGATTLLQQVLTQAGSNIAALVSKITGIAENLLTAPLEALGNFFAGFEVFGGAANSGNTLINQLVKRITGNVGTTLDNLERFFSNIRALFGSTNFLLPLGTSAGTFRLADAADAFISNVLSKVSTAVTNLIPNHALADLAVHKISDLVKMITGQTPGTSGEHISFLQNFFAGLGNTGTLGTGSLISRLVNGLTGKTVASTLADLKAFFGIGTTGGLLDFSGNNTLPIVNQIVKAITGRTTTGHAHPLADIAAFLGIGPTTDPATLNPFTGANNLIKQIIEKIVPSASGLDQLKKFFDNLRTMFGLADNDFLADLANFKFADAATHFVNNVLSKAGTNPLIPLTKIPGNILAVGISNIENLISTLTGGTSLTQFSNFFANLRKFLNIGTSGTNVVNFFSDPASFSIPAAIDGFIKNIIKTATAIGEIPSTLISAFSPAKIEGLIEALTGKTVDVIEADIDTFFANLRKMFNIGSGTGQINLLDPAATLTALRTNFFNFVSNLSTGINSFLTQSGLNSWLGGGLNLTEIGNFFTNLTKFFRIGDFKLTPTGTGTGVFDVATAAGKFIDDVINKATGFLINPLKVLGIDFPTLSGDLSARPLLNTLLGWVTGTGTANAFDTFFTNIRNMFGNGVDLLTTAFSPGTAQQNFLNVIKTANDTVEAFISKSGLQSWLGALNLSEIGNFFTNLTKFFKIGDFKTAPGSFNLATTAGKFINDVINQATGFLINPLKVLGVDTATLSGDLSARPLLATLLGWVNGTGTTNAFDTFFTNIKSMFSGINLLGSTFNASTAQQNLVNLIKTANDTVEAFISKSGLQSWLGALNLTEIGNFFTNLTKFFKIGDFKTAPGSFSLAATAGKFIEDVINQATGFLINPLKVLGVNTATLTGDLNARPLLSTLLGWVTGTGTTNAFDTFFTNIKSFLGGGIDLATSGFNATTAQQTLVNVIKTANDTVEAFISKSGLQSWLGALNLSEIGNFFTNLTKFFKIGDFKTAPGSFNLATTAGKFINDVINQATGFLIDPLKVLGISGGTLSADLSNRPVLATLREWLTTTNASATEDIQKFFTNLRTMLGNPTLLTGFNASTAQTALHNVVASINSALADGQKWATQATANLKAGIADLVQRITGATGATDLTGLATLFAPLHATGGTTLLDKLATVITGGVTSLSDFFAGLTGGTATTNSLVHKIVSAITGDTSTTQSLQKLGTFFGNITSSATTLIGKVVDHITGLITNGLSSLNLTQFFSGFNGATTATDSLAYKISQALSGGAAATLAQVDNFFKNLRSFLGIGTTGINLSDFLADATTFGTKLTGIINSFITNVLQRTGLQTTLVTLSQGATKLAESLIPNLGMEKITDLIGFLTGGGTSKTDVQTFFTNLRSFLGGGAGFLNPTGTFNIVTATENFISNVLKAPSVGIKLVTTGLDNLLDSGLIPPLAIEKITNLSKFLTGSATAVAADVERFFTNLRTMFGGGTNLLSGTFNFADAANQFITNVLSKASATISSLIPAHAIADFGIGKITNLIGFITGATGTAATNPDTLKNFFAGFAPFTGVNTIVNQITQAIFGTGGTLSQLQTFFSGLTAGFNPATGSGSVVHQIVQSITGKVNGALADIGSFLGIGTGNLTPFTGANNLIKQIVEKVVPTGGTLTDLNTFFTNIRNLFGATNFLTGTFDFPAAAKAFIDNVLSKVSSVTAKIPGLAIGNLAINQITNLIKNITGVDSTDNTAIEKFFAGFSGFDIATGANTLINQFVAKITGNNGQVLADLTSFFNNLRNFLGFNPVSAGSAGTLSTAVAQFFDKLNTAGSATKLNPANVLSTIGLEQIGNLVSYVTGGVGTVGTDLQKFFTNLRSTLGLNFLPAGGAAFDAAAAQKVVHDVVASINAGLTASQKWANQAVVDAKATIADLVQRITGTTGATTLTALTDFFSGLNGGTQSATGLLGQLVQKITGSSGLFSLTNLETLFTNLRSFLGFNPTTGFTNLTTAVSNFFTSLNTVTPTIKIDPAKLLANIGMGQISDFLTYLTGGSGGLVTDVQAFFNNLRNFLGFNPVTAGSAATLSTAVSTFFGNLNTITPATKLDPAKLLSGIGVTQITNLVSSLTGTGTNATDLATFFTNLRSTLNINFLPGTTFDAAAARRAIHDFVASINAGLAAGQKWATQAVADAKAGIADLVQRITGTTGATDLTGLGTFFSGLGGGGSLVSQFVSKITSGGASLTDLETLFTNLRNFLGFNPFNGFTDLTTAVGNFFAKLNTVTPGTKIDPAKLLSTIGMGQIGNLISYITGGAGTLVTDVQAFFNNLRNFLGFNPVSFSDFATAVTTFFGKLNTITPATKLDPAKLLSGIGIGQITDLIGHITGTGSVAADIQTFFTRLRSILGGVNPMSAASVSAEAANLFTALNGAASGTLGNTRVAGVENANLGLDLRGVFNNVVLGLQGKTTADLTGTNQFGLADILSTAKGTSETITGLAEAVTSLQSTADVRTNSGNSDFTAFSTFSPFNNGAGLTYLLNAGASALGVSGTQAVWQNNSATVTRAAQGIFTRTKTATDWQKVGIAFATAPTADSITNANSGFNYILGRSNVSGSEHVFVKFSKTGFRLGYTITGLNNTPTEVFFGTETSHNFTAGATYYLECGIPDGGPNTGQFTYRVSRNGVPLVTITDTAYSAYINADHRYGGFKVQATNYAWWVNPPGSMAAFAINDNTPAPYIGSGFRRYRDATNQAIPTVGENKLPNGFFNNADFSTTDYEYSSTLAEPNKVTVKTTGWYKVDINLGLVANTMLSEIAPTLYKNGTLESRGGSVWGGRITDFETGVGLATNRGPSQAAASFSVYLQAGEYIQPGYWQPKLSGTFTGDGSGIRTYMQVTFMNRSTE